MKILVLSANTASLVTYRLDMMAGWVSMGHQVLAVGDREDNGARAALARVGVELEIVTIDRNGLNPLRDARTFASLTGLFRRLRPDKAFLYHAKPIAYGSLAARLAGIRDTYAMLTGLGSAYRSHGIGGTALRQVLRLQYRLACRWLDKVFFQNPDDRAEFIDHHLVSPAKTRMVNGSGVDLTRFTTSPLPDRPTILFVGRLLRDKGVLEFLAAARQVRQSVPNLRCLLVGPFDTNPTALKPADIEPYLDFVEYLGEVDDVRPALEAASLFVLPSYHEGTPRSTLEAMATGRPVVTTDAPGCRETVQDGVTGALVPVADVDALARAIARLITNPEALRRMGAAGRVLAEQRFDVRDVNRIITHEMGLDTVRGPEWTPSYED